MGEDGSAILIRAHHHVSSMDVGRIHQSVECDGYHVGIHLPRDHTLMLPSILKLFFCRVEPVGRVEEEGEEEEEEVEEEENITVL